MINTVNTLDAAARARAVVEARTFTAMNSPRDPMTARRLLLERCRSSRFASSARYSKPVGGGRVEGFSIRFVEEALRIWRNVSIESLIVGSNEVNMTIRVEVTDLESNLPFATEFVVDRVVERSSPGNREIVGRRTNSAGRETFVVRATEDELSNKVEALRSKAIRNMGLRLLPSDLLEECNDAIVETIRAGSKAEDPAEQRKRLVDAFAAIGVTPRQLQAYLEHSLDAVSPNEIVELKAIYTACKDGEARFSDYLNESPLDEAAANAEAAASKTSKIKEKLAASKARSKSVTAETWQDVENAVSDAKNESTPARTG